MSDNPAKRYAKDFPDRAVLFDYVDKESGLRALVLRVGFSFCAYVGAPTETALAGLDELNFQCHHGITFNQWGEKDSPWAEGYYWWGWDYAHYSDELTLDLPDFFNELPEELQHLKGFLEGMERPKVKRWSLEEVQMDALDVIVELKEALEFARTQAASTRALPFNP